jgi:4-hydroxyphenylpyruvate dioxygenase-like putative hemolysin
MRLDHVAYRVRDRQEAVKFFQDAFGYKHQAEFEIKLEDGSTATCTSLTPPEKLIEAPFFAKVFHDSAPSLSVEMEYHLSPEIFVSSGPPNSLIDKWVREWGRGVGGIHHLAFQTPDVNAKMREWIEKGWAFTTSESLKCDDLTQVFAKPNPFTNVVYEFIERRGQHGFCKDNVARLMASTASLSEGTAKPSE